MNHSPGPWQAKKYDPNDGVKTASGEALNHEEWPWRVYVPSGLWALGALGAAISVENSEANARLIAAAPDLLAALHMIAKLCEGRIIHLAAISECANAAIAKAEGSL